MVRNYVYVSYGISCWIQHLERQNPQKAPKGIVFQRKKIANVWNHIGGKSQMVRNYVYVSYGISCWIHHLERQNPKKHQKVECSKS